ncbi:MAG: hypothetical protein AB1331_09315 [Bacillota bacterium]
MGEIFSHAFRKLTKNPLLFLFPAAKSIVSAVVEMVIGAIAMRWVLGYPFLGVQAAIGVRLLGSLVTSLLTAYFFAGQVRLLFAAVRDEPLSAELLLGSSRQYGFRMLGVLATRVLITILAVFICLPFLRLFWGLGLLLLLAFLLAIGVGLLFSPYILVEQQTGVGRAITIGFGLAWRNLLWVLGFVVLVSVGPVLANWILTRLLRDGVANLIIAIVVVPYVDLAGALAYLHLKDSTSPPEA